MKILLLLLTLSAGTLLGSVPDDTSEIKIKLPPVSIGGYAQIRYQSFQQEGVADFGDIRRARFDLKSAVSNQWDVRLQADLAGSPKLLDGFITYKPFTFIHLQAGQFKLPFSYNNITSSAKLDLIDRAQVVEALASRSRDPIQNQNGRDMGIMACGKLIKCKNRYLISYAAGIFNGNGINSADNNEAKDVSGRILLSPVKNLEAGVSFINGKATVQNSYTRKRTGIELSYMFKFATISAEYINGRDGVTEKNGYYGQLSTFIWQKKLQVAGRYEYFDADNNLTDNEIIYITGGINYFFNDNIKTSVNYTSRNESGPSFGNDLIAVMLQAGF